MIKGIPNIKTIIIGNDREFFSPVDRFVPPHLREEYYESDLDEADMDIIWEGDNKVAVMPRTLDPAYVTDISALFGYTNFHILTPHETGAGLCSDILLDKQILQVLVDTIHLNPQIRIIPFGNTPEFHQLILTLRTLASEFILPESPADNALWAIKYFDSKIGSRELLTKVSRINPVIQIPEGFVIFDMETSLQFADFFINNGHGIVYKANQGGSGIGVNLFPHSKLASQFDVAAMRQKVRENPLYNGGDPFIIEQYVTPDFSHYGVFPSVDARVPSNGDVSIEVVNAMIIRHAENEVEFLGCVVGKGLFTSAQTEALKSFTLTTAQILKSFGYVGWFDIDYILSPNGIFAATEINMRSTSMRYMIEIGRRIFGNGFDAVAALRSNDKYIRRNLFGMNYKDLKNILKDLLYPIAGKNRGIIISECMRSKYGRGKFGYCIVGADQDDTKHIENKMEACLGRV